MTESNDPKSGPANAPHRIGHVLPWPAVGGTEHATLRIAKAVDSTRFANIAFCVPRADPVRDLFANAGFNCASYEPAVPSYRHVARLLRGSLRLARDLKRLRIDLLHCADLLAVYHAGLAGWLAGIPVLAHIRNRFDDVSRRDCSFLWPVDKFIFVSRNTWQHFACRATPSRGIVIYDGIDAEELPNNEEARRSVCREFDIPERAPIVGMTARVAPQKDHPTLVRAAKRILQSESQTRFLVVGDYVSAETYREHHRLLQRTLEECGVGDSFIFTGHRQDVSRLLTAMDIFVLSTHWEGLPLVVLEAMAHAKPVVATSVDGIPEIIDNGQTGLLFEHEDHIQLAEHIIGLLRDRSLATRIAEAGRQSVQTRFSKEQFGANMNALYSSYLRDRGHAGSVPKTESQALPPIGTM